MYPNLRIQLWKAGIRQNRLARMLEMDETLLSRIVNGFRHPSPDFRRKISVLLQSDEAWLFQTADSEPPSHLSEQPDSGAAGQDWETLRFPDPLK